MTDAKHSTTILHQDRGPGFTHSDSVECGCQPIMTEVRHAVLKLPLHIEQNDNDYAIVDICDIEGDFVAEELSADEAEHIVTAVNERPALLAVYKAAIRARDHIQDIADCSDNPVNDFVLDLLNKALASVSNDKGDAPQTHDAGPITVANGPGDHFVAGFSAGSHSQSTQIEELKRQLNEARESHMRMCCPMPVSDEIKDVVEAVEYWVNSRGGETTVDQIAVIAIEAYKRAALAATKGDA